MKKSPFKPEALYQVDSVGVTQHIEEHYGHTPNAGELDRVKFYLTTDRILCAVVNQLIQYAVEDYAERPHLRML